MPSSCPCCSFDAHNENLFLPASLVAAQEDEEKKGDTVTTTPPPPHELPEALTIWKEILQSTSDENSEAGKQILLVDSHGHAHLEQESEEVYHLSCSSAEDAISSTTSNTAHDVLSSKDNQTEDATGSLNKNFISVSCTVEPHDWRACIEHASQSKHRMAALGVHPWYLADLPDHWLADLEALLQEHEGVMVGEIGLCKVARFVRTYEHGKAAALALQRDVFTRQLDLASAYQRPVTVHCVNQQQILLDAFKARSDLSQLPPAIALHSFTGTAHHVDQLLKWEATLRPRRGKGALQSEEEPHSPLLYFGFSHSVNYAMCSSEKSRKQGREAIRRVPANRLLAESDVHNSHDSVGGTALAVAYMAWALEEPVTVVAQRTTANALRFFQSMQKATTERKEL